MHKTHSIRFLNRRRFFTVLPLLTLPFLTLLFWTAGGGQAAEPATAAAPAGFNFTLPDAFLENKQPLDKLAFYELAEKDSLRMKELMKSDPYYQGTIAAADTSRSKLLGLPSRKPGQQSALNTSPYSNSGPVAPQETQIFHKLDQLSKTLNAATTVPEPTRKMEAGLAGIPSGPPEIQSPQTYQLQQMMAGMQEGTAEKDPEMAELNGMLERILDIQHPGRVQERLQKTSKENLGQVFNVAPHQQQTPVTFLDNRSVTDYAGEAAAEPALQGPGFENGFFGLDEPSNESTDQHAIAAVVAETQELVNGSMIKLRLLDDVYINGTLVPKDNFIYGTASLDGERLKIKVPGIRYRNSLFPVSLAVYDLDGLSGIHIPGAITRDATKQSGEQAIQSLALTSMDPSIGAQAASAGIELSKNLLSRKVRLIRVTVKAGYQVLLMDEKQQQSM